MADKWNIQDSIKYISQHAEAKSIGKCARYVRTAMEAGGINTNGRPTSAYQYKGYLPTIGFNAIGDIHGKSKQRDWSNKNAKPGDIAVMDHGQHGHICMWNGSKWISDFPQNNMWVYKGDGTCTIFRYGGQVDGSLEPYNGQVGGGSGSGAAGGVAGAIGGGASANGGSILSGDGKLAYKTKRAKQGDHILLSSLVSLQKQVFALLLEGEGVVCTNNQSFNDKYLIEDGFFKREDGLFDTTRIDGLYKMYDITIPVNIQYEENVSVSEFIALAVTGENTALNIGDLGVLSSLLDAAGIGDLSNVEGIQNPANYAGSIDAWRSALKSFGLTDNQTNALIACMIYECGLNHTLHNKLEFSGKGASGTEGWHCGEGTVGFTFWSLKSKLIQKFNSDSRHKKNLASTWEAYSSRGPRIIDLSLEDAALFTCIFYDNLIKRTQSADLDTCVAEFYLEKAGRGGSAKNGKTPLEKAMLRSGDYMRTHAKQGCKAKNTFLCTLGTARMLSGNNTQQA